MGEDREVLIGKLENEKRKTYKVKILFGLSKEEAWDILTHHDATFERDTFEKSWRALTKSAGA